MAEPDYVYDPEDWETTYDWSDRDLLVDNLEVRRRLGEIHRLKTLVHGPDKFVTEIVLTRDELGDPDETETRWFDSEDDARRAIAACAPPVAAAADELGAG